MNSLHPCHFEVLKTNDYEWWVINELLDFLKRESIKMSIDLKYLDLLELHWLVTKIAHEVISDKVSHRVKSCIIVSIHLLLFTSAIHWLIQIIVTLNELFQKRTIIELGLNLRFCVLLELTGEDCELWRHESSQGEVDIVHCELLISFALTVILDCLDDLLIEVSVNIEFDI